MTKTQKTQLQRIAEELVWQLSETIAEKVEEALPSASRKELTAADEFVWAELARQAQLNR